MRIFKKIVLKKIFYKNPRMKCTDPLGGKKTLKKIEEEKSEGDDGEEDKKNDPSGKKCLYLF